MGEIFSILMLSIEDVNRKCVKILFENIIVLYNEKIKEDKNRVYENGIGLISERIDLIMRELKVVEQNVVNFKSCFSMMFYSVEGNMLMGELNIYNKEIINWDV